jgi:predicted double-glycine peptidase
MSTARRVLKRFVQANAPVPKYEQKRTGYCGPAALRSVLLSYGVDKSEDELAKLAKTTEEKGTLPTGLVRAAKSLGFEAEAYEDATFDDLREWVMEHRTPVIVSWYSPVGHVEGHYSVVTKINEKGVYMMDPQDGSSRKLTRDDFEALWFDFDIAKKLKGLHRRQMVVVYQE